MSTAPANEALINEPYITTQWNGSLWYDSGFKGPPTPEVEENWQKIMRYGMIGVEASDYDKVNKSLQTAVYFPDDQGYMTTLIGTHHLHCLHYIWQDHYREYFPETQTKIKNIPEMYERHYEHCIDYLRLAIMCNYDTGIVTYSWVMEHQMPTPNANAMHKCVNWDAMQNWLVDRSVHIPDGYKWHQPPGQEVLDYNP